MTTNNRSAPSGRRDLGVFAVLVLLGLSYVASFLLFNLRSTNFIVRQREEALVVEPARLKVGVPLDFAGPNVCSQCLVTGWYEPERDFVWMGEPKASVVTPGLSLENHPADGRTLVLDLAGALLGSRAERSFDVSVRGKAPTRLTLRADTVGASRFFAGGHLEQRVPLPDGSVAEGRPLIIDFFSTDPDVPYDLGLSDDRRTLRLALRSLRLE